MLKNKYVAIALAIIAILLVANSIRILTKSEKKQVKVLKGPSVNMDDQNQHISSSTPPPLTIKKSNISPTVIQKNSNQNLEVKGKTVKEKISFAKNLREIKKEILNPEELVWGRDPFGDNDENIVLGEKKEIKFTNIFLSAIITNKDIKMCVINNVVYKEGERKNGIYVSKIGENFVNLLKDGNEIKINIFENKVIPLSNKKEEDGEIK